MYDWVTHTWNPIKGKCPYSCSYCYMRHFNLKPIRLDNKELVTNLGHGNTIFIGSSCDIFAESIPSEWIHKFISYSMRFQNNYILQSKNPARFEQFHLPSYKFTLGTTIESNREYPNISLAPSITNRIDAISSLSQFYTTFISIEPIIDFDLIPFADILIKINPSFITIGSDSKNSNLPEPNINKIKALISILKTFTKVRIKSNLKLLGVKNL